MNGSRYLISHLCAGDWLMYSLYVLNCSMSLLESLLLLFLWHTRQKVYCWLMWHFHVAQRTHPFPSTSAPCHIFHEFSYFDEESPFKVLLYLFILCGGVPVDIRTTCRSCVFPFPCKFWKLNSDHQGSAFYLMSHLMGSKIPFLTNEALGVHEHPHSS